MKAVILAAGKGTRMEGLCDALPKPLLPIANQPLLAHTLGQMEAGGVTEALLVIGHQAQLVRMALGPECGGIALDYVVQSNPKGTGEATALAEEFAAGEPFLMMFGDIATSGIHVPEIVGIYRDEQPAAILSVRYFRDPASGGAVYVDGTRVERIVERPQPGETTTHYINAGIFVFPPKIFDLLRQVPLSPRGEYELTDALAMLIDGGGTVRAYDLQHFWVNVTDPAAYLEAQRELFEEGRCPASAAPRGVELDRPVALGDRCRLGPCRVGPHVSIGDGCTVGEGAVVRDSILMTGARVGAGAVVESAVVGLGGTVGDGVKLIGDPDGRAAVVMHGESV